MMVPRFHPGGRFDPASLFRPESVAIIGVDTEAGAAMAGRLALAGFKGDTRLLRADEAIQERVDLAVLSVAPDRMAAAMEALGASGCHAAIVPGPAGRLVGDGLAAHAARTGVRVLGAHSFGLVVPRLNLVLARTHIVPPAGRLALVGQSGGLARAIIDWAAPNGVGFSHIVGIGTNDDIGFGLVLDWLSRDAGTGAIVLDIRRIKNRRAFLSAARAAARLRPVVAIRAGLRSDDPADTDAALAFEAALGRVGVLCVERLDELLAAAETLSRAKPVRSERLAIAANATGGGRLAADAVAREGLSLAAMVVAELPDAVMELGARADVGAVLAVHTPAETDDSAMVAELGRLPDRMRVPLIVCAMGETTGALHRAALGQAGLAVFDAPEQAVAGFGYLVRDRRNRAAARELPPRTVLSVMPDRGLVRRLFTAARREGRAVLAADEALAVLEAYGVPTVPTRFAADAADAGVAAALLGYPAVVKLRSFLPPADRSAERVVFGVRSGEQATAAAASLLTRATAEDRGFLVQRQVARAAELAIRVADDAMFGPVIRLHDGAAPGKTAPGEIAPGEMAGGAAALPPLNLPLAQALIRRCPAAAALASPARDRAAMAVDAVARVLVQISQLVVDSPELAVLDVASLFADADGVLVADAWLRLRGADEAPMALAITPYPAELIRTGRFGGDPVTIRPIRPEDAEAHAAFFLRLSPEDVRFRFFSAMREMSKQQTVRLTHVDYDREIAFVAVRDGDTVGVARLALEPGENTGEFAVIVQADMKGRGLASELMRCLLAWGRARGLSAIVGQVLADNAPMLAFVRHFGFSARHMADDPGVMEVRLAL
jgi:acetyltransferase